MLNCVYHPIDDVRVVDNEERERLLASGFWFDSPKDAADFKEKVKSDVEEENKAKPKLGRPKKESNDA